MFIKEPWFWRGFQSAVFYYISCAPCTKITYQRKRRKESRRAKAEKERAAQEGPPASLYPEHPLPSGTNPFWKEEMTLGPGPPPKRRRKEDESRLMEMQPGGSGVASSSGSKGTSSDTMDGGEDRAAMSQNLIDSEDDGWNRRRYQREDEILWGLDETISNSTGISHLSNSGSEGNRYYARNPAVNDLHPPVVSMAPISRLESQWMLQPPPRAKIMEGKEKSNRCRSASGTSNDSRVSSVRKTTGEPALGRQLSERLVEAKLRQGDQYMPAASSSIRLSRSRGSSNQSHASEDSVARPPSAVISGQRHDRDQKDLVVRGNGSSASESVLTKTAPPPISIENETTSILPGRPPLSTIVSTSLVAKGKEDKPHNSSQSQALLSTPGREASSDGKVKPRNSASSLDVLQDLDPNPRLYSDLRPHDPGESQEMQERSDNDTSFKKENLRPVLGDDFWFTGQRDRSLPSSDTGMTSNEIEEVDPMGGQALEGSSGSKMLFPAGDKVESREPNVALGPGIGHRHRWSMDI